MVEKSAGSVIFYRSKRGIEYLLLKHDLGHWDFPKGHTEKDETTLETARREIKEETGLSGIIFISGFKEHIRYLHEWKGEKGLKVVTLYLAESKTKQVKISEEHLGYRWVLYEESVVLCKFENQKSLLKKANEFLMEVIRDL